VKEMLPTIDQVRAIDGLCAALGRPAMDRGELALLNYRQAGDLILKLRAETRGETR